MRDENVGTEGRERQRFALEAEGHHQADYSSCIYTSSGTGDF